MSAAKSDDFDATRAVIDAVKDFKSDEQQRIFRWAAEKLGLPEPFSSPVASPAQLRPPTAAHGSDMTQPPATSGTPTQDIRSFVAAKNPKSDVQFAATIAYYYQFEAPQSERKPSINGEDLQEATRRASRDRLKNPSQTLINAHNLGFLDRTGETGQYSVNTVGENLVAMTLPSDGSSGAKSGKRAKKSKKRAAKKKPAAKKVKKA